MDRRLAGVPLVLPFESVSSWLGRLALSQGVSLAELSKYLDIDTKCDVDMRLRRQKARELLDICGQDKRSFDLPLAIFSALRSLVRDGGRFLNVERGRARYRFCPCCLSAQPTPYFPLHWRFVAWRWCPVHDCLLENACPHCSAPLIGPADQLNAGRDRKGVGLMSYCMSCSRKLSVVEPCYIGTGPQSALTEWERVLLRNGRAVLAALYTREVQVTCQGDRTGVRRLKKLDRLGLLPHGLDWLTPAHLRERQDSLRRSDTHAKAQACGEEVDRANRRQRVECNYPGDR